MLGIKQMKSAAANERYNAGLNMIGGAASNYAMGSMFGGAVKTPISTPSALTSNIPGSPYGKYSTLSSLGTNLSGFKSAFGKTYQNNLGGLRQANNYPTIEGQSFYPEY
jgi:hypothetical protein